MSIQKNVRAGAVVLSIALGVFVVYVTLGAQAQSAPRYLYDPGWPKPLPNNWKMGGITGLAVAPNDDTVWAYDRPNDLTNIELEKEIGIADCCTLPPSMLHFDKEGTLIGSFNAPQGHGMDVDSKGRPANWSARSSTHLKRRAEARSSRKRTCPTTRRASAARVPSPASFRRLPVAEDAAAAAATSIPQHGRRPSRHSARSIRRRRP